MKNKNLHLCFSLYFLLVGSFALSASPKLFDISNKGGYFSSDQRVVLYTKTDEVSLSYWFEQSKTKTPVLYRIPLILSAIRGEEREYTLHIEARKTSDSISEQTLERESFRYVIDKKPPSDPTVSLPSGEYSHSLEISFEDESEDSVIYSINQPIDKNGKVWDGKPLSLPVSPGETAQYTLVAYKKDKAGNKSALKSWKYILKGRKDEEKPELEVLSPVPGKFANRQFLYISDKGFEWIRYSFNEKDPEREGIPYSKPVEIAEEGDIILNIAGKEENSSKIVKKSVHFSVSPSEVVKTSLGSGVYTQPVTVEVSSTKKVKYCFSERTPGGSDGYYQEEFALKPVPGSLRFITLRMVTVNDKAESGAEFRYFFIIDDRIPLEPTVVLSELPPINRPISVKIESPEYCEVYYTIDGTTPDKNSNKYQNPFKLELPEERSSGSITIRAVAFSPNGKKSAETTEIITYDKVPPEKPIVKISEQTPPFLMIETEPGSKIHYILEYDGYPAENPSLQSPSTDELISLSVPFGMDLSFFFLFAAVDPAGNISEVVPIEIISDRNPPQPPEIRFQEGIVLLTGEEEIYYSITEDGSSPPHPIIYGKKYTEPLFLPGNYGKITEYSLSALSRDSYGNMSTLSGPLTFKVDRSLPEVPSVIGVINGGHYNKEEITLWLEETKQNVKVYYTHTSDGTEPEEPGLDSPQVTGPLTFKGEPDEEITYRIKFLPVSVPYSDHGNIKTITFTIDLKPPSVPKISGIKNGGVYREEVSLVAIPEDEGDKIFISYSEGENPPPDPFGEEWLLIDKPLKFDIPDGEERKFQIKIGVEDIAGNTTLDETIYTFTIDKKPPELPEISGVIDGGIYNRVVEIGVSSLPAGHRAFAVYSETEKPLPDPFGNMGLPLTTPLVLRGRKGEEIKYSLKIGVTDAAGNRTVMEDPYRFIIDRMPPGTPKPLGIPVEWKTGDPVLLDFADSEEENIYYELTREGETLRIPSPESSPLFVEPVLISGEENREITFYLSSIAVDSAGNQSPEPLFKSFTIDRKPPDPLSIPSPEINVIDSDEVKRVIISLKKITGDKIYYRTGLSGSPFQSPVFIEDFSLYTDPVEIAIPEKTESITIEYFAEDNAGNRTGLFTKSKKLISAPQTLITGAENNHLYNERITLKRVFPEGLIRYETAHGKDIPSHVNRFSPILEDSLIFDAAEGETVRYTIRVRLFEDKKDLFGSREQTLSFIIDKTKPLPPEVSGIEDGETYHDDCVFTLHSSEGEIYYKVKKEEDESFKLSEEEFKLYTGPVTLSSKPGVFLSYLISAYTVDTAGNRSVTTGGIRIFIDRKRVYVSKSGNDEQKGTKDQPLRTLQRALEYVSSGERNTILLDSGTHYLENSFTLKNEITVEGGFDYRNWRREDDTDKTFIKPGSYFPKNKPLFTVEGGNLTLREISISADKALAPTLLLSRRGGMQLERVNIALEEGYEGEAIKQEGGKLYIANSLFKFDNPGNLKLVSVSGGELSIDYSVMEGAEKGENTTLLFLRQGGKEEEVKADITNSRLLPGRGKKTVAIDAEGVNLRLNNSEINSGEGSAGSIAVLLRNGSIICSNSQIYSEKGARIGTAVDAERAKLVFTSSTIVARGDRGAAAIQLREGEVHLERNTIRGENTEEFLYIFRIADSKGAVFTNHIFTGETKDFIGAEIMDSSIDWFNNTMIHGTGERSTIVFLLKGEGILRIINNIVLRKDSITRGIAVALQGEVQSEILSNNFNGFKTVLRTDKGDINSVKQLDISDGKPFGGTRHGNISEEFNQTFKVTKAGELKLNESSICVDSGVDVSKNKGPSVDWEGERRPNPQRGITPKYDIGADEYYDDVNR